MRTSIVHFSVAIMLATSIVCVTGFAEPGEKGKKLTPATGKIELKDGKAELKGKLADGDPKDVSRNESFCKIYTVKLDAGQTYQLDCKSGWDNWLRIEDAKGKQVAEDDDGGGGTDAHIDFECKTAGEYRVIVTSFGPAETGDFTLTVSKK